MQLILSVQNQVNLEKEPSLWEGLGESYAYLHSAMRRLERVVASFMVTNQVVTNGLVCSHEGKGADIYICNDLNCAVHGSRNKSLRF
jgi:hypothetical protein